MRAVTHFRACNLSWPYIRQHLNKFTVERSTAHLSKILNVNTQPLIQNSQFPLPGNINLASEYFKCQNQDSFNSVSIIDNPGDKPQINEDKLLECTVHSCLDSLKKELKPLFSDRDITTSSSLTTICFNHRTSSNMSSWDASVARERELLATIFVETAKEFCETIKKSGYWADFIDPFSGTPHFGAHTNDTLFETDPRMRNFGYSIEDLGCCKVLSHPVWREHMFAGLLFTDAPSEHPLVSQLEA